MIHTKNTNLILVMDKPYNFIMDKPYNSIVDSPYVSIMDKPHNYIIMCNFTLRNSQKPGEETNKWCRVAKLSLHVFLILGRVDLVADHLNIRFIFSIFVFTKFLVLLPGRISLQMFRV